MAAMNQISDLKPFKSMWRVKVKIIRLWKQNHVSTGETIEMVFVDSRVRLRIFDISVFFIVAFDA